MARQNVMPPFAYYGGKTTLAPIIAKLLPEHDHYVEPFAGSLAVLLAKRPSAAETVNDLDKDIVSFWRVLRDRPDELLRSCALTPHSRIELRDAYDDTDDELEQARRVWVRLSQSRGKTLKRGGWWNALGSAHDVPNALQRFATRIPPCAERLINVTLECRDALDVIRDYGQSPDTCLYVDPPYLLSTRSSTGYRVEMAGDDAHRDLADALNGCQASVVLSGYASPLYADLFPGWHEIVLRAPTTLAGKSDVPEVLWSNVRLDEPDLFDLLEAGPHEHTIDVELDEEEPA